MQLKIKDNRVVIEVERGEKHSVFLPLEEISYLRMYTPKVRVLNEYLNKRETYYEMSAFVFHIVTKNGSEFKISSKELDDRFTDIKREVVDKENKKIDSLFTTLHNKLFGTDFKEYYEIKNKDN